MSGPANRLEDRPEGDNGAQGHFFDGPIAYIVREPDENPNAEWIEIHYEAGGKILVYTDRPLVFVEPDSLLCFSSFENGKYGV